MDRHVGPVAHKIGPVQTERLVEEAIARFMPATAEETRRRAADGRHFTVDHDQVSFAGTSLMHGELDLADALDLDQAVGVRADHLQGPRAAPSRSTCGARWRSGSWPAASSPWTSTPEPPPTDPADRPAGPASGRATVVLYLHLHQSAIEGAGSRSAGWRTPAAWSPSTRSGTGAATPTPR